MLEIIQLSPKTDNGYFVVKYIKKVLKSPVFWIVIVYTIFLAYSTHIEDPKEIPYPIAQINFKTSRKYISSNYAASSRLGNHLFELASVLSISRDLNRVPIFFIEDCYHEKMWEDTNNLIPGLMNQFWLLMEKKRISDLKIARFKKIAFQKKTFDLKKKKTKVNIFRFREQYDEHHSMKNVVHLTIQSWKYFSQMRNELLGFLKTPVNNFFYLPVSSESTFVTCVHIRRGDFLRVGFHVAGEHFIKSSMDFVQNQEGRSRKHMATVFFGDDFSFMDSLRNRTVYNTQDAFVSQNSPSDDLLYSKANCDVVIITAAHSTFGWWMGYLSKGNTVYYTDIKYTKDYILETGEFTSEDYYPPHWTPLKYAGSNNLTVTRSFN
ncbi:Protein CBG04865 [Caenorhabditis briggsae]|uniref:Protein CBG04865 n=1 Tax=Caenorhabditis briggsae TaxID=6238 RepID=A8WYN5_CAEBR|nr:Protein CBG04865 [Caenorhabditis briggsae]CAP25493.2 Protein CBG04865 [Caenorhabditis briggsae]